MFSIEPHSLLVTLIFAIKLSKPLYEAFLNFFFRILRFFEKRKFRMNHQPQQPISQCSLAIGMGATMGAGIGGSAGVCIGGFTGFFSGYRGMSLIKHAGK